jgi:hypothetical protein
MSRFARAVTVGIAMVAALWLTGCPGAGVDTETATVSVNADLAPAFDAGVQVDAVSVFLENDQDQFEFDLAVDSNSQAATGSQSDVPLADYTATVVVENASGIAGQASGAVSVREDTTITVVIEITIDDDSGSGGSIDVGIE